VTSSSGASAAIPTRTSPLRTTPAWDELTPAELQVLALAAEGLTSRETAVWLGHSVDSVRSHRRSLRIKLGAHNMPHAVALGLRGELIE
jgi:DNA-binding CsgD family transcriptional regulator